jgi:hypothetical protein
MRPFWEKLRPLKVDEFLDDAISDGRIRYTGFSFHDEVSVFKEIVDACDWIFCQIRYNFMMNRTRLVPRDSCTPQKGTKRRGNGASAGRIAHQVNTFHHGHLDEGFSAEKPFGMGASMGLDSS